MNIQDYAMICLQYGITEEAMDNFVQRELILCEAAAPDSGMNEKYKSYVARCHRQGIEPKPYQEYLQSRAKTIKALKIGAAAAGTLAVASGLSRHTKAGRKIRMGMSNRLADAQIKVNKNNREIARNAKKNKRRVKRAKHSIFG